MKWEPSEDSLLKNHYSDLGASRCGLLLGRSEASIQQRAYRLGLLMENPYNRKSNRGLDRNQPTYLYFISIPYNNTKIYKLGITNSTVQSRYKSEFNRLNMKLEWLIEFETGKDAYETEQKLLSKYADKLINTGLLKNGNTETLSQYIEKEEYKCS